MKDVAGIVDALTVLMVRSFNYLPMVKTFWLRHPRGFIIHQTEDLVGIEDDKQLHFYENSYNCMMVVAVFVISSNFTKFVDNIKKYACYVHHCLKAAFLTESLCVIESYVKIQIEPNTPLGIGMSTRIESITVV